LTAWDHLVMAGRYYPNVDEARMDKVLEIVGLAPYKKERCGKFSLGMKQRMGLALALLSEPELMILDEPTNGLDIEATVEIREIIIRLAREKGVTFLVASHLASEIEKMCSKVMVLYEGEMLSCDSKEEALRLNPSLEDYFLAKVRDKKGSVVL
ncbi:MAG: ABC transporter ATP-binding protein, partial [Ruminiclostridium sp.]|nr:ABC transporter ATP-binding protein [Ruminiclostridium sp.]